MAAYGPLMLACYGVSEQQIRESWTLADFDRYCDFARDVWLKRMGGGRA